MLNDGAADQTGELAPSNAPRSLSLIKRTVSVWVLKGSTSVPASRSL